VPPEVADRGRREIVDVELGNYIDQGNSARFEGTGRKERVSIFGIHLA